MGMGGVASTETRIKTMVAMKDFFRSDFAKASRFHWDFHKEFRDTQRWEQLAISYSDWKQGLAQPQNTDIIPKVIHQIWLGPKPLPDLYRQWGKSWLHHNPDFTYRLWRDCDIDSFGLQNRGLYDSTDNYGARSDLARYEILHRLGGIYVDTDFECVAPIPRSLLSFSFVACLMFNSTPEISNGMLMAAPDSPLLAKVIRACTKAEHPKDMFSILHSTGPFLLTREYFEASSQQDSLRLVLPSNYFFPWPNFAMDFKGDPHGFIAEESIGIHHWQTSWFERPRQGIRYHLKAAVKSLIRTPQRLRKYTDRL